MELLTLKPQYPNFSSNIPSPKRARSPVPDLLEMNCGSPLKRSTKSETWTEREHSLFLEAICKFGRKKQTQIANYVVSKDVKQVISHSQKFFKKLTRAMDGPIL
jgi:SHAQKYF class myb-like DNA-binding protein